MFRKPIIYIIAIIIILSLISCTPTTSDTSELFREINRLEGELELKETEVESLETELGNAKQQLQTAQEELEEKANISEELPEEEPQKETPFEFTLGTEILFSDTNTNEEFCSVIIHSIKNFIDDVIYSQPDEGMRHVAIDVEVNNLSSEVQGYNGFNYAFRDADSYRYDSQIWIGGKEPSLGSGDLAPGDRIRGWVTIELPEDIEIRQIV